MRLKFTKSRNLPTLPNPAVPKETSVSHFILSILAFSELQTRCEGKDGLSCKHENLRYFLALISRDSHQSISALTRYLAELKQSGETKYEWFSDKQIPSREIFKSHPSLEFIVTRSAPLARIHNGRIYSRIQDGQVFLWGRPLDGKVVELKQLLSVSFKPGLPTDNEQ